MRYRCIQPSMSVCLFLENYLLPGHVGNSRKTGQGKWEDEAEINPDSVCLVLGKYNFTPSLLFQPKCINCVCECVWISSCIVSIHSWIPILCNLFVITFTLSKIKVNHQLVSMSYFVALAWMMSVTYINTFCSFQIILQRF